MKIFDGKEDAQLQFIICMNFDGLISRYAISGKKFVKVEQT